MRLILIQQEAGEPIFWGESFMDGLPFIPNPTANLVCVKGLVLCLISRTMLTIVFFIAFFNVLAEYLPQS